MKKHFKYLSYVMRHKWFVMLACWEESSQFTRGLRWLGIVHDWSKLRPSEWIPYADHFYGPKAAGIRTGRDETGYYQAGDTGEDAFDMAWLWHQKRNKHHWQWWILPLDDGGFKAHEMPEKYATEMVCEWIGAGRAQGTPDVVGWYLKNGHNMIMHLRTRITVEKILNARFKNALSLSKKALSLSKKYVPGSVIMVNDVSRAPTSEGEKS